MVLDSGPSLSSITRDNITADGYQDARSRAAQAAKYVKPGAHYAAPGATQGHCPGRSRSGTPLMLYLPCARINENLPHL